MFNNFAGILDIHSKYCSEHVFLMVESAFYYGFAISVAEDLRRIVLGKFGGGFG